MKIMSSLSHLFSHTAAAAAVPCHRADVSDVTVITPQITDGQYGVVRPVSLGGQPRASFTIAYVSTLHLMSV
jgi:hypothetical protein